MKTIAIDFDGVIHKYSKGWHDGTCYDEPMEGAKEFLEKLVSDVDMSVFILSTRDAKQIQAWMAEHIKLATQIITDDVVFWNNPLVIGITNRKLPAMVYIDDRGVLFDGSWDFVDWQIANIIKRGK